MKIALAMIVKGSDEEAVVLDRCLESVMPYVDSAFITITYKNEKTRLGEEEPILKIIRKYAEKGYVMYHSSFKWVNDFAAARNHSFAGIPKEYDYIMWCDADDIWRGLDKLRDTVEANKEVDAFSFFYLYDFDKYKKPTVVHKKTQIVRNDGCVEWAGALHEDFKENRSLNAKFIESIERLHLTTEDRFKVAAARNVEVSKKDARKNPNDPRVYWNLGNSYLSVNDLEGARKSFEKFLKLSESEDEKFLIYLRLADIYRHKGDTEKATECIYIAIGLKPLYPDPYLQAGYHFLELKNPERAIDYFLLGLPKKPAYHSIMVYNPRDYDYNPMMALAKAYIQINRPDSALIFMKAALKIYPDHEYLTKLVPELEKEAEKLEKVLQIVKQCQEVKDPEEIKRIIQGIPEELQSHPKISAIRNSLFIKQTSSGKDLVIYCGYTTHEWNPEIYETKGFGGSEEAVYYLSKELIKLGWNVTVYNNCGLKPIEKYGVKWMPFWMFNPRDKQDILILWRHPKGLDYELNANKIYVDMHDVLPKGEFTEKRLAKITKIFIKSNAHRVLFPNVPDDKFVVVPNGLDISLFTDTTIKKDPYLLINTSSADRSLNVLPKLFKRIKEKVPQAKMKWAYGWGVYDNSMKGKREQEWKQETIEALKDAGIEELGKLNPEEVAKLYLEANILMYPTEFYEIDCISVRKAQLAGCLPITTDFAALETTNAKGIKIHSPKTIDTWGKDFVHGLEDERAQDEFVTAVVEQLQKPIGDRSEMINWAKEFNWENTAKIWNITLSS